MPTNTHGAGPLGFDSWTKNAQRKYLKELARRNTSKKTRTKRNKVWNETKGHCVYCNRTPPEKEKTLDHLWPKSKGGTYAQRNLLPACRECNNTRADGFPVSPHVHKRWKDYVRKKEVDHEQRNQPTADTAVTASLVNPEPPGPAVDWKDIAVTLAKAVDFAIANLKASGSGVFDDEDGVTWHWKDQFADSLERIPGVKVDREAMHALDLPKRKREKFFRDREKTRAKRPAE